MSASTEPARSARFLKIPESVYFPAILALLTLVARIMCRGPVYFADGPAFVASIVEKTYIIQPPGYWLFNRIAGLFPDPALGIAAINIFCSVAGVVVFYYTACLFTGRRNAFLAAFAYSTVFYVWFSGEIHSTYATQILFPVATYYLLLRYDQLRARWLLWLAALTFAVGAGLRPTDGVFLLPLVLYFAFFRMARRDAAVFLSLTVLLCLGWIIPTWLAFEHVYAGMKGFAAYVEAVSMKQSFLTGIRMYTLANPVRYILPVVVGFWPVLGIALANAIRQRRDWRVRSLLIWIVPGSLYFIFFLITCAPYLNCITAAILLLAVSSPRWMTVTAVWNAIVFLALGPIPSQKLSVNIVNSFVLRCTRGGIEQRYNTTLTEMQHLDNAR
jgi:4-amino-4-deoxy-L-arabinose transferase-like glycosyltransferase